MPFELRVSDKLVEQLDRQAAKERREKILQQQHAAHNKMPPLSEKDKDKKDTNAKKAIRERAVRLGIPIRLHKYCMANRPVWLPKSGEKMPLYEPILWWCIFMLFNCDTQLDITLYKKRENRPQFRMKHPTEAHEFKPLADTMQLFNVHFPPKRYLQWLQHCSKVNRTSQIREKRAFLEWLPDTVDQPCVDWLAVKLGLLELKEEHQEEELNVTTFVQDEIIPWVVTAVFGTLTADCILKRQAEGYGMEDYINLSCLGLLQIPQPVYKYIEVRELHLRHNKITEIPPSIGAMRNLELLHLSHNRLSTLPEEIKECWRLQRLYIDNNIVDCLPDSIGNLRFCKLINASHNNLMDIPFHITQMSALQELYLDYNQISWLPPMMEDLKGQLTVLQLNSNCLMEGNLPDDFKCWGEHMLLSAYNNKKLGVELDDGTVWHPHKHKDAVSKQLKQAARNRRKSAVGTNAGLPSLDSRPSSAPLTVASTVSSASYGSISMTKLLAD